MRLSFALARAFELSGEPRLWPYLVHSKKPSLASYRICQAVNTLAEPFATVFDVGANQGQFAGAAAHWFPDCRIVSFEPSPRIFPLLRKNTAQLGKIQLVQSALGDRSGELDFFENSYSHASSALAVNQAQKALRPETGNVMKITVPVTTLDAFSAGQVWPRPLLLKLDVQGLEKSVLAGATQFLREVDYLLFECSYRALYEGEPLFGEMYSYVRDLGFELIAPVGKLEDENHVMLQADLLWRNLNA